MLQRIYPVSCSLTVMALLIATLTAPMIVINVTEQSVLALFKTHISIFAGMADSDILRSLGQFGVRITPSTHSYSIIAGAKELWLRGDILPSAAIVVFSIALPVVKTLHLLIRSVFTTEARSPYVIILLNRFQRFAMLDVFVTAILVFAVSNGIGYEAVVGSGFYLFIAYYVAHMAATWLILPAADVKSFWIVRQGANA